MNKSWWTSTLLLKRGISTRVLEPTLPKLLMIPNNDNYVEEDISWPEHGIWYLGSAWTEHQDLCRLPKNNAGGGYRTHTGCSFYAHQNKRRGLIIIIYYGAIWHLDWHRTIQHSLQAIRLDLHENAILVLFAQKIETSKPQSRAVGNSKRHIKKWGI